MYKNNYLFSNKLIKINKLCVTLFLSFRYYNRNFFNKTGLVKINFLLKLTHYLIDLLIKLRLNQYNLQGFLDMQQI